MKYIYFVSYVFQKINCHGFSSAQASREKRINSIDDISDICKKIEISCNYQQVTIINYKLLRIEKG